MRIWSRKEKCLAGQLKQIYELQLEINGQEQVVLTEKKEDCFDKQREEKDRIEEFRNKEAAFWEDWEAYGQCWLPLTKRKRPLTDSSRPA